jgi:hypothetical protein
MNDIGVDINLTKSYIALKGSGEFAKRHFINGQNISGFGYQMVVRANASMPNWIYFMEILESEGFIELGATLLLPGNNGKELSNSYISELTWL